MSSTLTSRVDAMATQLRRAFEMKAGYKDESAQAAMLARHFRTFDRDGSGVVDFDEFSRAMLQLHFVGVQAEVEALFDRFDEDLNGVISYAEFARGVFGLGGSAAALALAPNAHRTQSAVATVRDAILAAGGKNGIRTIGVLLRRMDQNGNGVLEFEEFRDGLAQLGAHVTDDAELARVFRFFDSDNSGKITVDELMRGLRGPMSKRRILLVRQAFSRLDTSGDGNVTLDEIEKLYDASQHPEVLAGRLKPQDALLELMRVFEERDAADGTITWHEFLSYYRELSGGMRDDDEFELMMRNAWHLSGGEGWSANSSCRRVLATFADGSQRVLEIEDDLGIARGDTRRMLARLAERGHRNIVSIELAH